MKNITLLASLSLFFASCQKENNFFVSDQKNAISQSSSESQNILTSPLGEPSDPNLWSQISNDENGDVYFHDIYSGIFKVSNGTYTTQYLGTLCFPVRTSNVAIYQGIYYAQLTSVNPNTGVGYYGQLESVNQFLCSTTKLYNTVFSGYLSATHTDYKGKIYCCDYNAFNQSYGTVSVENPSLNTLTVLSSVSLSKDLSCDANGNLITVRASDGSVHFWGMKIPYAQHIQLGTLTNAKRVAVDKITNKVYVLLSDGSPQVYDWGTNAWYNLSHPIPGSDICAYNNDVFIISTGRVYKAQTAFPLSGYFTRVYPQ